MYEVCPEGIQPCNMKNRDVYWRRYKKHCTQDNDTSVPFKVGTLRPHIVLPVAISFPVVFSWISSMVWNLFPLKGDFSFGKRQKLQGTKSGSEGGWVIWVIWCYTKKLCAMDTLSWWSCQSPVAHSCGLLNHPNSFHGRMFKLKTESDTDLFLYSRSHFECHSHHSTCAHSVVSTAPSD